MPDPSPPFFVPSPAVTTSTEDFILILSRNTVAAQSYIVNYRYVDNRGRPGQNYFTHTPNTDRSLKQTSYRINFGTLVGLSIQGTQTARRGQSYANAMIGYLDNQGNAIGFYTLCRGYVQTEQYLSWPYGPQSNSTEGPGILATNSVSPGAGVEITITVPTGARWRIIGLRFLFTASATAVTRTPSLLVDNNGANVHTAIAGAQFATVTANNNQQYSLSRAGFTEGFLAAANIENLFENQLIQGGRIRTSTTNLQGGDQYSSVIFEVEEWLEA